MASFVTDQSRPTFGHGGAIKRVGLGGSFQAYRRSGVHRTGMNWMKETYGLHRGGGMMSWLGRGFLGLSAYTGYQHGGISGAAKSVAGDLAISYGLGAAWGALKPALLPALAVGGMVGGLALASSNTPLMTRLTRPWVNEYMKKHARLEMATPIRDDYGNVATMRQRSLQAINNSKLNGRTALGNEAMLSYTPYYR